MKRFLRRRGQAAVEFSLLLPIFALILFATIYAGFFVLDYVTLDNAAAQTARHAALNKTRNYTPLDEDKTIVENTQLFFTWYELKSNCVKCWRGDINSDGEFEPVAFGASGDYVQIMIQATWREDKSDALLGDILPNKYTVSKVVKIED